MFSLPNGKATPSQILFPLSLVAFVLFIALATQFFQNMRDRDGLHQARVQQEQAFQDAMRLSQQLNALKGGTIELASKGDKDARAIVDRMKKLGIPVDLPSGMPSPMAGRPGGPAARAPMGAAPPPPPEEAPADR